MTAAIAKQLATVNTNVRYLHDGLCTYAEALTATFPDPLSVSTACFLPALPPLIPGVHATPQHLC